jgi:hypothetical protein
VSSFGLLFRVVHQDAQKKGRRKFICINKTSACNDRGVYLTITLTQGSMAGNFTA